MPQHWVGRFRSTPRWLPAAAVLLALVVGGGPVQLDSRTATRPTAADAALDQLAVAGAQASRLGGTAEWETGTVVVPGDEPHVQLYVAHNDQGGWTAALEGSVEFGLMAEQAAEALDGTESGALLETTGPDSSTSIGATTATVTVAGNGAARLSLPWAKATAWRLTGGPHNNNGGRSRPWSSIDFAGPRPGMSVKVRAARDGIVVRPCANLVQVRHDNGWTTSYYHLRNIAVRAGQRVARGALLGYTSNKAGCGGSSTGPHVHFSLLRHGSHVNIRDHVIGGWRVVEGSSPYEGCMAKDGKRRCAIAQIFNDGSIGSQ